jgi:hypothetical protein
MVHSAAQISGLYPDRIADRSERASHQSAIVIWLTAFSDHLNWWINFAATPELAGRAFLAGTHPIIARSMHVPVLPVYRCA